MCGRTRAATDAAQRRSFLALQSGAAERRRYAAERSLTLFIMSFNTQARKVQDANQDIWIRWSSLHSCLLKVVKQGEFGKRRKELFGAWQIGPGNPTTHEQLVEAINRIEVERNRQLERLRVYERKRIRQKMRGRRSPPAA